MSEVHCIIFIQGITELECVRIDVILIFKL
jgi:hypothetical protein